MRSRLAAVVALLVGTGFITVACSDDDDFDQIGIFGAGTEIGDGFTVTEGTRLLGTRFPLNMDFDPRKPAAWVAILLVDGHPKDVLAQYAAQAAEVGLPIEAPGSVCYQSEPGLVECWMSAIAGPWNAPAGRSVQMTLSRSDADSDEPYASHLVLRYETWGIQRLF